MFRRKRSDTTVGAIERQYGVVLNARSDMKLGNLLEERGFDSLTQFLAALRGTLLTPARRRRVFLSFHAEDLRQVNSLRLMAANPRIDFDFYDGMRAPVNSERAAYVRAIIKERIAAVSVLVCLIGNGTAWRDWVEWEVETAFGMRKGICGVRLRGSRGRTPSFLLSVDVPIVPWSLQNIIAVIECAAARRS